MATCLHYACVMLHSAFLTAFYSSLVGHSADLATIPLLVYSAAATQSSSRAAAEQRHYFKFFIYRRSNSCNKGLLRIVLLMILYVIYIVIVSYLSLTKKINLSF